METNLETTTKADPPMVKRVIVETTRKVCLANSTLVEPCYLVDVIEAFRKQGTHIYTANVDTMGTALIVVNHPFGL